MKDFKKITGFEVLMLISFVIVLLGLFNLVSVFYSVVLFGLTLLAITVDHFIDKKSEEQIELRIEYAVSCATDSYEKQVSDLESRVNDMVTRVSLLENKSRRM